MRIRHEASLPPRRHSCAKGARAQARNAEDSTIAHHPTSEAAADWVVRLAREDADQADWLAFADWLEAAPPDHPELHRQAFDRAQALWFEADSLKALPPLAPTLRPGSRRRPAPRAVGWGLAAAAGVAAVMLGLWLSALPSRPPAPAVRTTVYATAPGERRHLVLPDGSRIELDGGSELAVRPAYPVTRSVSLLRGEAAFDVTHDPARPFSVVVGDARVRVLGTAFDILRDPGLTEVSVARGLVALDGPRRSVRLPAGRSAILQAGTLTIHDIAPAEVASWRTGRRTYWDQPLDVVVADLNRTYPTPIRIGDAATRRLRFTGVLAPAPKQETVRRLAALLGLTVTTQPDGAAVVRRSDPR